MTADDEHHDKDRPRSTVVGVVRRSPSVLTRRVTGGEELALPVAGDHVLELRGTAHLLWNAIQGESNLGQVVDQLADAHGVERAAIEDDVLVAVDRLVDEGLLERIRS